MSADDNLQEMLERLGRTLGHAMERSDAAAEVVERVRREGLSLYLVLQPRRNEDGSRGIRLVPAAGPARTDSAHGEAANEAANEIWAEPTDREDLGRRSTSRLRRAQREAQRRAQSRQASYRLDQSDVDFLRSLGIDPSRTGRSKR